MPILPTRLADFVGCCYTVYAAPTRIWQQRGGESMDLLLGFLVSVVAGVVAYYICKWLDRHDQDKEQ